MEKRLKEEMDANPEFRLFLEVRCPITCTDGGDELSDVVL